MSGPVTLNDIKTTKKGRYALFCDGEFLFSVDEETLVRHRLEPGMQLSEELLKELEKESDLQKAREKAFTYLSIRDHGERELYGKLKKNFDAHTCAAVVARMKELGLLDDRKYAQQLYGSLADKGKSAFEIRAKFQEKGLSRDLYEEIMEHQERDETAVLCDIIEKRYRTKLQGQDGVRKVHAALARRGFRGADIRRALAFYTDEEDDLTDE